jgi:hypothetical protein
MEDDWHFKFLSGTGRWQPERPTEGPVLAKAMIDVIHNAADPSTTSWYPSPYRGGILAWSRMTFECKKYRSC